MRHGAHAYCKPEDTKVRSVDVIDVLGQLGNAHVGVMRHGQDAKDSQVPPRIESCAQGSRIQIAAQGDRLAVAGGQADRRGEQSGERAGWGESSE